MLPKVVADLLVISPVLVVSKKPMSWLRREWNSLVRMRKLRRAIPKVKRPPLMPVNTAHPNATPTSFRVVC